VEFIDPQNHVGGHAQRVFTRVLINDRSLKYFPFLQKNLVGLQVTDV
jgi:hypothetical protein